MNVQQLEDVRDTAMKLNQIRTDSPEDFFYLKGWIHCLSKKEYDNKKFLEKEEAH